MYVLSYTIAVCKYAVLLFLQHESRTTWDRSLKHREDLDMQHAAALLDVLGCDGSTIYKHMPNVCICLHLHACMY